MKKIILMAFLSVTSIFAEIQTETSTDEGYSKYLNEAVESVEKARKEALDALDTMVKKIDLHKESNAKEEDSISTQIVETHALGEMAKSTADVEIAKTRAIVQISKAVDSVDNANEKDRQRAKDAALEVIIQAIASVEIAKAKASKNIVEATKRVELSKICPEKVIPHEKETLSIAKNIAAVQIAQSVADVQIAQANSLIELARSSIKNIKSPLSKEEKEKLQKIKAEATAKISSYLSRLEVLKAEISTKIADEIAKVEIAENKMMTSDK